MKAVILTFHAIRRGGNYAENDHIAFDETLAQLCALKMPIRPLHELVAALINPLLRWRLPPKFVVLTCDDGEISEVETIPSVEGFWVSSLAALQQKYLLQQKLLGGSPHLTSFVIASSDARNQICPDGVLADVWWREAALSPLMAIENHSWDHCHINVAEIAQHAQRKGTFDGVDTYADADKQISQAARTIDVLIAPAKTNLFAYPYGDTNAYLIEEYFPRFQTEHKMKATLTTEPNPVTKYTNRWAMPRYVCGHHWKSSTELRQLLKDATII